MKRKKLKVKSKSWRVVVPACGITTMTGPDVPNVSGSAIDKLQEQVTYLQLQLSSATARDAKLSVENMQLRTQLANVYKALGLEAPI